MKITVMSFNIQHCFNYVTKEIDFDAFAREIRSVGADIVGLNEVRGEGPDPEYTEQARILGEMLGFNYYFGQSTLIDGENPYGNAVLSKYPILSARTVGIPDPEVPAYDGYYETRSVLEAKIDVAGGLTVNVTHFGLNPDEAANAAETVQNLIKDERYIVRGDFNITPDDPLLLPLRERLYDTAELFGPDVKSYPSDAPEVRIDHMFASRDIKVLSARVPAHVVSDHRPYVTEIEI